MSDATPFPVNAAKFSWMAPIGAVALRIFSTMLAASMAGQGKEPDPLMATVFGGIGSVLIFGGLLAGILALLGAKKYGAKGIVFPAVAGIVINLILIVTAILMIMSVRSAG